ncbi:MAG: histone deacetylase [Gammaproteobacteria bacterium]|nr:histone deacetylase [Gammaproteobacteria bacterium]
MKCSYHGFYPPPLPAGHPFPVSKYPLLREQLLAEGIVRESDLVEPAPVEREALALVHTADYLERLESGELSAAEIRRLGLPWSEALWRRSRLATGGTLLAARTALVEGMAANLAGGTHHAFADHGEGFCVINDVAVATRLLCEEGAIRRAVIVDLDVHQGNGTARIFADDRGVYTFSMHGERNYPTEKMRSSLDLGLEDGTGDEAYLDALARHLPQVLDAARADLAFYLAGVDVAAGDRYGKLALSEAGIRARDRMVIEAVRSRGLALAIVLAGGYAPTRERTAQLHTQVFRAAADFERGVR